MFIGNKQFKTDNEMETCAETAVSGIRPPSSRGP
jgi:hypothetical protein